MKLEYICPSTKILLSRPASFFCVSEGGRYIDDEENHGPSGGDPQNPVVIGDDSGDEGGSGSLVKRGVWDM
ncbi:MAG: hypothetical protein IIU48_07520 [Prevotella sp.]|nr:hypothetical protein [Prevotella sp.]